MCNSTRGLVGLKIASVYNYLANLVALVIWLTSLSPDCKVKSDWLKPLKRPGRLPSSYNTLIGQRASQIVFEACLAVAFLVKVPNGVC